MKIFEDVTQVIGDTPLIKLQKVAAESKGTILAKLESMNPLGSIKERIALSMIHEAEANGKLSPGDTVIEPTSGNTGIGLALVCAVRGYDCILVMPETVSEERKKVLSALGAEIILTPPGKGMKDCISMVEGLVRENEMYVFLNQFTNPANPRAHKEKTGMEIWRDTEGEVDILVAGAGTGGTITGATEFLKSKKPSLKSVVVEPAESPVLSQGRKGSHKIEGIGPGFIPEVLRTEILDEIFPVKSDQAINMGRRLACEEGIMCGTSSGAAVHAAVEIGKRLTNRGMTIVVILPDTGMRYLSTELFARHSGG